MNILDAEPSELQVGVSPSFDGPSLVGVGLDAEGHQANIPWHNHYTHIRRLFI
jgi:hypothetical protein